MNVTPEQKEAAEEVVNAARVMQLHVRKAEKLGLSVSVHHFGGYGKEGSRISATCALEETVEVATTEEKAKVAK